MYRNPNHCNSQYSRSIFRFENLTSLDLRPLGLVCIYFLNFQGNPDKKKKKHKKIKIKSQSKPKRKNMQTKRKTKTEKSGIYI